MSRRSRGAVPGLHSSDHVEPQPSMEQQIAQAYPHGLPVRPAAAESANCLVRLSWAAVTQQHPTEQDRAATRAQLSGNHQQPLALGTSSLHLPLNTSLCPLPPSHRWPADWSYEACMMWHCVCRRAWHVQLGAWACRAARWAMDMQRACHPRAPLPCDERCAEPAQGPRGPLVLAMPA